MKKILIITNSLDTTIDYFITKYHELTNCYRVNIDLLSSYYITITNDNWIIKSPTWSIAKHDIDSIYYRKPLLPDLSEYKPEYHSMISKDIMALFEGIINEFQGTVLSKPYILKRAENKIFQLLLANKLGFIQPLSLITNNQAHASQFINNTNNIIKPLTTGKVRIGENYELYYTSKIEKILDEITLAPIYLQRNMPKCYEVRLTIINKQLYPVKIIANDKTDWRKNQEYNNYEIIAIPKEIEKKCIDLMNIMEIDFGAFDFIVHDDKWIFLEVNPNGQWLWLEQKLDLNISECILQYLLR